MKKILKIMLVTTSLTLFLASCSEDFLDRPLEDAYNIDEFYKTVDQVESSTNALYSVPWYEFNSNVIWCIGELSSGNGRTWDPRNADFTNFAITGVHSTLLQAWESLYAVVAQSNFIINTLPEKAGANVPKIVVNNAVGEARFMRAMAYFYLVRIYGSVPIIADNTESVLKSIVPRNPVEDVYKFMKLDLEFAIANCYNKIRTNNFQNNARVSSGSAKALLAKIYLYEKNYQKAFQLSSEVINSGEFKLLGGSDADGDPNGSYYSLFLPENDNNPESIFSLQWVASSAYAEGNRIQSLFAPSGFTGGSDGWSAIGASPDLIKAYEQGDKRLYATLMVRGANYPDLNGGYTVPNDIDFQGTRHGLKKYVVGSKYATVLSNETTTTTYNNTYILRYGELLLIHAEAALSGGGNVAEGIKSFNKIRKRAGLPEIASPTLEHVFKERRIELAFEFEFWYDIVRRGPGFALNYLSKTDRGTYNSSTGVLESEFFTASDSDLLFPYPTTEVQNNPALLQPPVPYNF